MIDIRVGDCREHVVRGGTSAGVVETIFASLPPVQSVLDLTYGQGTFWKWEYPFVLQTNDLSRPADYSHDLRTFPATSDSFDAVVFDPPFTAQGPNRKAGERHNDRYGATRDLPHGPKNIHDVHALLTDGIREACRLARNFVIVKTQDVVESGRLHPSVNVALNEIVLSGFNIRNTYRFFPSRRPQPNGRRVTGLGGQPSVFIVAEADERMERGQALMFDMEALRNA